MAKKSFPLPKVYSLIEPGPVVMVTTAGDGKPNIMTMSWHMMLEFEPPLAGCVISENNYSFGLSAEGNQRMRDQHTNSGDSRKGRGLRQYVGRETGQVRGIWSHTRARFKSRGASHRRGAM